MPKGPNLREYPWSDFAKYATPSDGARGIRRGLDGRGRQGPDEPVVVATSVPDAPDPI